MLEYFNFENLGENKKRSKENKRYVFFYKGKIKARTSLSNMAQNTYSLQKLPLTFSDVLASALTWLTQFIPLAVR